MVRTTSRPLLGGRGMGERISWTTEGGVGKDQKRRIDRLFLGGT